MVDSSGRDRKKICVSFGHLHSFDAGLGEFAYRLGKGLADRRPLFASRNVDLSFHLAPHLRGSFGQHVDYCEYRWSQEVFAWNLPGCTLWHNAFQHNITKPPVEAVHRSLTVHDLNYLYGRRGPGAWKDEFKTRLAARRSNRLIAITEYVANDVRRHLAGKQPVAVIYNGATDMTQVEPTPVAALEGRTFMFHMSRMAPSKNVESLLSLATAWPEKTFVFAGPAWGHSLATRDRVGDSIPNAHFLLGISESTKAWLLAHCEAFLFPSHAEGFGLPPIEAMYFGAPVFLSDRTCLPEIGGDYVGYFDGFEPQTMRNVIERELPRLQGARARTHQRASRFSWDACADAYTETFLKVLG